MEFNLINVLVFIFLVMVYNELDNQQKSAHKSVIAKNVKIYMDCKTIFTSQAF